MARPHIAALVEDSVFSRVEWVLRRRGWVPRVIGYAGYGSPEFARVLARVLLTDPDDPESDDQAAAHARATEDEIEAAAALQRGWRAFVTAPAISAEVTVTLGDRTVRTRTDRGGYLDLMLRGHGLPPGWHDATISAPGVEPVTTPVQIIGSDVRTGIISDIDDTVIITHLPRLLIAAWNTFVLSDSGREPVPGMAQLYGELLADAPGAPVFYLSTGAWNTAPALARFLKRQSYPRGILLLTDWGPTNTGWFRSGMEHKTRTLQRLAQEFPGIRWVLVGDDGQHDPHIYTQFACARPEDVDFIAIRELSVRQQVLSHGLPVSNEEILGTRDVEVPVLRAPDGHGLLAKVHEVLGRARRHLAGVHGATAVGARRDDIPQGPGA